MPQPRQRRNGWRSPPDRRRSAPTPYLPWPCHTTRIRLAREQVRKYFVKCVPAHECAKAHMPKRPTVEDNASSWRSQDAGNIKVLVVASCGGCGRSHLDRVCNDERTNVIQSGIASRAVRTEFDHSVSACHPTTPRCPSGGRVFVATGLNIDSSSTATVLGSELQLRAWLTALIAAHRACALVHPVEPFAGGIKSAARLSWAATNINSVAHRASMSS